MNIYTEIDGVIVVEAEGLSLNEAEMLLKVLSHDDIIIRLKEAPHE